MTGRRRERCGLSDCDGQKADSRIGRDELGVVLRSGVTTAPQRLGGIFALLRQYEKRRNRHPQYACSTNGGYPLGSPNAVMARMRNIASGAYAACVEAQRARTPPVNWTPTRIRAAARQAVVNKLRDPSSAQFRNVRRIELSNGSTMFCGEVNSRNAYGGMSGFQRFEAGVDRTGDASALIDGGEELNTA